MRLLFLAHSSLAFRLFNWPQKDADAFAIYSQDCGVLHNGPSRLTPSMDFWNELREAVPQEEFGTSVVAFEGDMLGHGDSSRVYALEGGQWAIKYHSHCADGVDPILREAFFLQLISERVPSITNRFLYISDAVIPTETSPYKSGDLGVTCGLSHDGHPPVVRYMISELVGLSIAHTLRKYEHRRFSFMSAIYHGIEMFRILSKLHELRFVHHHPHIWNFIYRDSRESWDNLILIDFERVTIMDDSAVVSSGTSQPPTLPRSFAELKQIPNHKTRCHPNFSPWESLKSRQFTYRDDTFRVALSIAAMVHGIPHLKRMGSMCQRSPNEHLAIKTIHNFFDISTTYVVKEEKREYHYLLDEVLPEGAPIETVRNEFKNMLKYIRRLGEYERPDYHYLIGILERIAAVVAPSPRCALGSN